MKFGHTIPTYDRFQHSKQVFSAKWSLLTNLWKKFSPSKVSCYMVCCWHLLANVSFRGGAKGYLPNTNYAKSQTAKLLNSSMSMGLKCSLRVLKFQIFYGRKSLQIPMHVVMVVLFFFFLAYKTDAHFSHLLPNKKAYMHVHVLIMITPPIRTWSSVIIL